MTPIVECVPNVSEGRDRAVIDAIADAIRATPGCELLDVDPGRSTNRTVYTFVGAPAAVVEGALAAARVARRLIDMRRHKGEHPRIGALDVCPFVPVRGVTMAECVDCAEDFATRLAAELAVPVYLYGEAQPREHRRSLAQIREGEYEGLRDRLHRPEWAPDRGPAELVPEWGATAAGARRFLIAYNVNMLGTREQAHRIALNLREQGRGPEAPGRLAAVKAIGWHVSEYGMAQVSMNIEDHERTPLHVAFEECVREARALRVAVAGSELVGLVPLGALLATAEHHIARDDLFLLEERDKVRLAVERLGLSSIAHFDPARRVIEYRMAAAPRPLAGKSVADFVAAVAARTPTPGGGSAAALIAALGAALATMVGLLTYGKRKFEKEEPAVRRALPAVHRAQAALVALIDADSDAFEGFMAASAAPAPGAAAEAARRRAMQAALRRAVEVPLETMVLADSCWDSFLELARHGALASRSDLEVGARALEAGLWAASRNVGINLEGIEDDAYRKETQARADEMVRRGRERLAEVLEVLGSRG